jgi:hypothetical protein
MYRSRAGGGGDIQEFHHSWGGKRNGIDKHVDKWTHLCHVSSILTTLAMST